MPYSHTHLQHNKQSRTRSQRCTRHHCSSPLTMLNCEANCVADCDGRFTVTRFPISRYYKVSSPCSHSLSISPSRIHSATLPLHRHFETPPSEPFISRSQWTFSLPLPLLLSSASPQNPRSRQTPVLTTTAAAVMVGRVASSLTARQKTTQIWDTSMRGMAGLGTTTASLHEILVSLIS